MFALLRRSVFSRFRVLGAGLRWWGRFLVHRAREIRAGRRLPHPGSHKCLRRHRREIVMAARLEDALTRDPALLSRQLLDFWGARYTLYELGFWVGVPFRQYLERPMHYEGVAELRIGAACERETDGAEGCGRRSFGVEV